MLSDANAWMTRSPAVAINGNLFPPMPRNRLPPRPSPRTSDRRSTIRWPRPPAATDPFDEIDFGSFFDDYLDPGYKSPASESVEKPSFETFLSAPVTLGDHLRSQLSVSLIDDEVRDAAESIIGNLDEDGYLTASLEEIAAAGEHTPGAGGSRPSKRCNRSIRPAWARATCGNACCCRSKAVERQGGVAWQIVSNHLRLLETRQYKELAQGAGPAAWSISRSPCSMIQHLNPRPGLRYSGAGARVVEPDVYFIKDGDDFIIQMNDEDVPQLRLNAQYRKMLDRDNGATKEVRDYVRERYTSAIQLMKNIEQRKQTILKVCQAIVRRQMDFLSHGHRLSEADDDQGSGRGSGRASLHRQPRRGQQVRAHAAGRFELRYFFSEAVQGPSGGDTPLLLLKRKVKKMIEEEDRAKPLTDEQITAMLQAEGIDVTRRTVAKYREDMKIPSTHQRRVRN